VQLVARRGKRRGVLAAHRFEQPERLRERKGLL
jgi:hypothetical protein